MVEKVSFPEGVQGNTTSNLRTPRMESVVIFAVSAAKAVVSVGPGKCSSVHATVGKISLQTQERLSFVACTPGYLMIKLSRAYLFLAKKKP